MVLTNCRGHLVSVRRSDACSQSLGFQHNSISIHLEATGVNTETTSQREGICLQYPEQTDGTIWLQEHVVCLSTSRPPQQTAAYRLLVPGGVASIYLGHYVALVSEVLGTSQSVVYSFL